MWRPSRLSLCVLALVFLQIVAPFANAVELRVREHTLNRARLRADAQAATQTQTTTQSQSTASASTQTQAKASTNATAASTAHSQLEAQIEAEVQALTRTIADASAAAGASVKQTLETLASIQGSAALTADLAAASERITPDLDPLTTPLSQLLGGRPPPPPKPVELFIGDNNTISRLIMQSPPRDAFVWSNFNDGSFSLTVGSRHVMLFGKQKVPVKAPAGPPRMTNTTVPTPAIPSAPVRFRSVPDHEETVKPHFMYAESQSDQVEAKAPAPAAAAPAANSVLANFMAAQQRMQAAAQDNHPTAAAARQRMYDLADGEDVESDSVDFTSSSSEQAAAPSEAASAHRFAAGSADAEDPYADNPLLHGFFKHGDMGKSILSAIADDKSEDGEEAVDQAAAKEVDQWSHEIDGKTFVNDKDLEAADSDDGDLSFLELDETKRVARVATRRARGHISRHYSTAPGGTAGTPNATANANSTKNGTAPAAPKPSPVSNITGEFRFREFLKLGNVTARGKLNITKHSPVLRGLPQFALVQHDDFDTHARGWSDQSRQVCGDSEDFFLGGPCKFSDTRATKTYRLPPHRFVRVTARYHFFDKWEGEFGFLKLDNVTMWTQAHHHCPKVFHQLCKGISVCGDENTSDRLSTLIDVTIPHNIGTLSVSFDSSLSKRKHPCQASFGIDDVAVYAM